MENTPGGRLFRCLYALWYWPLLVGLTLLGSVACLALSPFSPRLARWVTNVAWGHIVLDPAAIRLRAQGRENLPPGGGFVVYANHGSLTDIPAISLALGRPVSFVAKAALGKIPFFGWAMTRAHMVVDREGGAEAARQMVSEAQKRLGEGQVLAIFPEGTRNKTPEPLLPFKKGAFILAKHAAAPLVPVAVKNSRQLWPAGRLLPRPGEIKVKIGPPLPAVPGEGLAALTARARETLAAMLADQSW